MELETHLQIATRLGMASETAVADILLLTGEIGRMLNGLRNSLGYQVNEDDRQSDS